MTLLRAAAALAFAALLCACADAPSGNEPVGAPPDPMTDTTLGADPLDPGRIDDNIGTPM